MNITPELITATAEALKVVITAGGAVVATVTSVVVGYFTWKTRFELDQLYATKYRPKPDGSPGEMRKHPSIMVKMFKRKKR